MGTYLCDPLGKLSIQRADVGSANKGHLAHLLCSSLGNLGVRVAKVHDGVLGDEVDVRFPVDIGNDVVFGTLDGDLSTH